MAEGEIPRPVVLVVEDESIIRMALVSHLRRVGFIVRECNRADGAVDMLMAGKGIDAVVTDVRMPGNMDGLSLISWMRDNCEGTPVIVTSGYVTQEDARKANPLAVSLQSPTFLQPSLLSCRLFSEGHCDRRWPGSNSF